VDHLVKKYLDQWIVWPKFTTVTCGQVYILIGHLVKKLIYCTVQIFMDLKGWGELCRKFFAVEYIRIPLSQDTIPYTIRKITMCYLKKNFKKIFTVLQVI